MNIKLLKNENTCIIIHSFTFIQHRYILLEYYGWTERKKMSPLVRGREINISVYQH
jgi:hypothetical protein